VLRVGVQKSLELGGNLVRVLVVDGLFDLELTLGLGFD
jgi:hypothetical protein